MTSNTNSSQGTAGSRAEPEAAKDTQQSGESWPTWCSTCQALKAGEHACEKPASEAAGITKPEPVYQSRLSHDSETRPVFRAQKREGW
ncbi:uncharacterized protein PG986_005728 [Apiospora aurea]|uniref:Uncharacterized protein n=1 Tax=Apiospora aurea TaxID=335848 RepID=A0ABR1QIE5_9PEZI